MDFVIANQEKVNAMIKTTLKIDGMMCNHCRMHAEQALNSIDGVQASVTLDPAEAIIQFSEGEKPLEELQKALDPEGFTIKPLS